MKPEKPVEKIKLMLPSQEMRNRIMEYRAVFIENGESHIHGSAGLHRYEVFGEWLKSLRPDASVAADATPDWPPTTVFIAVRLPDNAVVGIVNIRHYLTEAIYHNGHIGYSVHPRERGKGYGTEILRKALIKAEQLGIIETVVTCNENNIPSKRVIQKNGLKFQKKFTEDSGNIVLIYTTG